jgi:hypothetical protein
MTTATTDASPQRSGPRTIAEFRELFMDYQKATLLTSEKEKARGDDFGRQCALARARAYGRAAELITYAKDIPDAVKVVMAEVLKDSQRTPPLIGYDETAYRYLAARAYQLCAQRMDPDVKEIQPQWSMKG